MQKKKDSHKEILDLFLVIVSINAWRNVVLESEENDVQKMR